MALCTSAVWRNPILTTAAIDTLWDPSRLHRQELRRSPTLASARHLGHPSTGWMV
jgi:hypothetical protein